MEFLKRNDLTLPVAEKFYSIQAEGITNGHPAYFIRLKGCNLLCGNPNLSKVKDKTNQVEIESQQDPKATWTCDSIAVWLKGKDTHFNTIISDWKNEGVLEDILRGNIHIVWTGGEPTLHDNNIVQFIDYFNNVFSGIPYHEIETNGTRLFSPSLLSRINQINCSPKLSNCAVARDKRINPDAITQIVNHPNGWLKFVVSTEDDIKEAIQDYITPLNVPQNRVILMPGLNCRENYHERTNFVYEMAKKYRYIAVSRNHISAWDKKTGC
jgi:organic radical activating enzyme